MMKNKTLYGLIYAIEVEVLEREKETKKGVKEVEAKRSYLVRLDFAGGPLLPIYMSEKKVIHSLNWSTIAI